MLIAAAQTCDAMSWPTATVWIAVCAATAVFFWAVFR